MIRGQARRASGTLGVQSLAPTESSRAATWTRRVLLLTVALGMVLMHHLMGAHQHAPAQPGFAAAAAPPSHGVAGTAPGPSSVGVPTAAHDAPAASASQAPGAVLTPATSPAPLSASPALGGESHAEAFLHVHHDQSDGHDMAAMLHECLAVLAAAMALALASCLLRRFWPDRARPASALRYSAQAPRPPRPVPVLLAQLQILRL